MVHVWESDARAEGIGRSEVWIWIPLILSADVNGTFSHL